MKIGYFADGPWAHKAFEKLIEDEELQIMFIVPRADTKDDTLKLYAQKYKIDYIENANVNSDDFLRQLNSYECDLFVSMSFNQIFKERILKMAPRGIINCHAGKLPFYRGRNVLNWVLINDEKDFGITVHYVDYGIDTGDIILQKTYPITMNDNYKTLLELAYSECANILYESVKLIQNGSQVRISQESIHPVGTYFGKRQEGDEIINWNSTSKEIFNFIRAICKPGPQGLTMIGNNQIKINKVSLVENAVDYKAINGQVVGRVGLKPIVKTKDSIIIIDEYESCKRIKVGERFTSIHIS